MANRFAAVARALIIPAGLVAALEIYIRVLVGPSDVIAPPSAIALAGLHALAGSDLFIATGQTLLSACMGLAIGCAAGSVVGLTLGLWEAGAKLAFTTVELLRPVPVIALVPLALLAYGFGYQMEVFIIALATFWPCLILSQKSVAQIHRSLFDLASVLALGKTARFFKIILPAALPRLFLAVRVSAAIAIIVAVTVEIVANPQGIGYFMMTAQQSLHPALTLWGLVWVGLMGWGLNRLLLAAETRIFGQTAIVDHR